jgi:CrcB protein
MYEKSHQWQLVFHGIALGTFSANMIGCFLLGIFFTKVQSGGLPPWSWYLFATGFCGGLTTFSTLMLEIYQLNQKASPAFATLYVLISVLAGLLCLWAGMRCAVSAI